MESMIPKGTQGPEAKIQAAVIKMLRQKQWHVMVTQGNMYQSGFPDLFATHVRYGPRWIEVKLPNMIGSSWTPAQKENFPKMIRNGSGIWILVAATESEYAKLFKAQNYWKYTDIFRKWHSGV